MTVKTAIARIKKHKPRCKADLLMIGLPATYLSEGAFRTVVRLDKLPLVVKFPMVDDFGTRYSKYHSTMEVRRVKKLSKFKWIKPYLPEIYHHDRKTGVLVMKYYTKFKGDYDYGMSCLMSSAISKATGVTLGDIQPSNFGVEEGRYGMTQLKIIDLGL